jgi:tripartite-type tricarboxylate transporter receptor subunit TctC
MKLPPIYRLLFNTLFVIGSIAFINTSQAQEFPSKSVTLVSPYAAGGIAEAIAKLVSNPLKANLKQAVAIENLGGDGGTTALLKILNAPANGYLVLQGTPSELILAPSISETPSFKSEDFRMVQFIADMPMVIVARKDLDANDADELTLLARRAVARGKPLVYASLGEGTFNHFLGSYISKKINAHMLHAPYASAPEIMKGLLSEQVDIVIAPYTADQIALHNSGKIKFLSVLAANRQPVIPDVSSVDEGFALRGCYQSLWTGYLVKKGTPETFVQVLHKALSDTLNDPQMISKLLSQGAIISPSLSLDDANKKYAAEIVKFRAMVKSMSPEPQ